MASRDLNAVAQASGARLVRSRVEGGPHGPALVGRWQVADSREGDPLAAARMLGALIEQDAQIDPVAQRMGDMARGRLDAAPWLHAQVLSAVRFLPEKVETFRSPRYTMDALGAGDCDDSTRLLLSSALVAGVPAAMGLLVDRMTGDPVHVSAVLGCMGEWCWAETSVPARFGEDPRVAQQRLGAVLRTDIHGDPLVIPVGAGPAMGDLCGGGWNMSGGNPTVLLVQNALNQQAGANLTADGVWGTNTSLAIASFQQSKGMPQTGLLEPAVLTALGLPIPPLSQWSYLGSDIISSLQTNLAGICDPLEACKLMLHESGMQPFADNGAARGIFQLDPSPVGSWPGDRASLVGNLSLAAFKALTAAQQVPFAAKFWRGAATQAGLSLPVSGRDLYWLNYLPATVVPGAADDYVIVKSNNTYQYKGQWVASQNVYTANPVLDHGKKGYITAGDLAQSLNDGAYQHPDLYAALAYGLNPNQGGSVGGIFNPAIAAIAQATPLKLALFAGGIAYAYYRWGRGRG